ncbi:MAG: helix-turn-helix transcriptional regulator [Burkholderiaceae bacterium]|nr:helix-turn-helix transcriptional regulator [Burkholderiaceae bacterium]
MNALATVIKRRRSELGFSQEDLAGWCQLDRPYISLIEVGRKQPTLSVLLRLADGLQYSLSELMALVQARYGVELATVLKAEVAENTLTDEGSSLGRAI